MRWPWSRKPNTVRLDEVTYATLALWAHERNVEIDDLVRDVLRAVLPSRFQAGVPEPGKVALAAVFDMLDEEGDQDVGIPGEVLPPPKIATAPAANQCLHLSPELPGLFRPGEVAGICRHSSQKGRPCFWVGASARQCPLFRPDSKYLLTTAS